MSEADIKIRIIRLIDSLNGEKLEQLYDVILNQLYPGKRKKDPMNSIEIGYKQMSEDTKREAAAFEWIEGTIQAKDL